MFARRPGLAARLAFWAALAIALVVLDARFNALGWLRAGVSAAFYPVQRVLRAPFDFGSEVTGFLVRHRELQSENTWLRHGRQQANTSLARLQTLQGENEALRRLLGLRQTPGFFGIAAEILNTPRDPFSRRVILDRGANAGVEIGRPVVDDTGLIGQVTRVYPFSSEVTLITDPGEVVPAEIQRTGQRVLVSGGSGGMEVRYLPTHADIQHGDVLVTSGIDRLYPHGLAVARVTRIQRPADSAYARIDCLPLAGVEKSSLLLVLTSAGGTKQP